MISTLTHTTKKVATGAILAGWLLIASVALAQDRPSGMAASKANLLAMTTSWKGERSSDGRPKVADDLLRRMKSVSIEEAWEDLRVRGFENQFVGGWQIIHPDQPLVGRALTAAYLPGRPDLVEQVTRLRKEEGRIGPSNSWPILSASRTTSPPHSASRSGLSVTLSMSIRGGRPFSTGLEAERIPEEVRPV